MEKNLFKSHNANLINYTFQIALATYATLLILEEIWKGFVSTYINLNLALLLITILGILSIFSEQNKTKKIPSRLDYLIISILTILGFMVTKSKTASLDFSLEVSLFSSILIAILCLIILENNEKQN